MVRKMCTLWLAFDSEGTCFMTDLFKEIFDAASSRVRSPFFGSIALVFVISNWQPLFYLVFADKPVRARFLYFDANTFVGTLFWIPIGGGILLAVLAPWLRLIGAWLASVPTRILHNFQHNESQAKRIYALDNSALEEDAKARYEEAVENRKIQAARRLEEAGKIFDESIRDELQENLLTDRQSIDKIDDDALNPMDDVSDLELKILQFGAGLPHGSFSLEANILEEYNSQDEKLRVFEHGDGHRSVKELENAIEELEVGNYLIKGSDLADQIYFEVTLKGHELLAKISEFKEND